MSTRQGTLTREPGYAHTLRRLGPLAQCLGVPKDRRTVEPPRRRPQHHYRPSSRPDRWLNRSRVAPYLRPTRIRVMPTRLCAEPGCPSPATYRGRCQAHARTTEQTICRAGYSIYRAKRWQLLRRRVLFEQPICAGCNTALAVDVDHITPLNQGGQPYNRANVQGLCRHCHGQKTRQEQGTQWRRTP